MQLGEDRVVNDDHSSHSLFYSDLVNHLYGFQLGAEGVLWKTQSLQLGTGIKAGIYHNSARIFAAFPQPGPAATLNAGENHAAFCGDLWLDANYKLTRNFSVRAGYKAMWLEGVALLSHQLDDLTVPIISEMDMGESPIYHSATFGLQLDW